MSIIRVGTNKKYSDGWEAAFGKGGKGGSLVEKTKKAAQNVAAAVTGKKATGKKKSTGKPATSAKKAPGKKSKK